ncbi:MAG: IgGFc-binding protein [Polyangiaceae bacterium]|nr:IgGFc-binding protein [Polyangiaceae bacterium]
MRRSLSSAWLAALALSAACRFDRSDRWLSRGDGAACVVGERRCSGAEAEACVPAGEDGAAWQRARDCGAEGLVCLTGGACAACSPGLRTCKDTAVVVCREDGSGYDIDQACDTSRGSTCRVATCVGLCGEAEQTRSNVGCEYFAVDLDNAFIDPTSNAAGQQFAVVVSNPQPDVPARVTISQDDGAPGDAPAPAVVAEGKVQPLSLTVFKLGPREVDGSPEGQFDAGTGTALTRRAYRLTSDFPVVVYQFNPLDNASVFSNDASLLKPVGALAPSGKAAELSPAYVVSGWPQTIASTDDPNTNFNPQSPIDLRAFVTIVGARPDTRVRVTTTTRVIPGGPVPETKAGGVIEATLSAYDVLNLESGGFNADFTGTLIEADGPVVVFSGSEASDAPHFQTLASRACCADHLEEQLDPIRTAGTRFVAAHGPSRTRAVRDAGADVAVVPEPEYFRVVAAHEEETRVTTTLPPPNDHLVLPRRGAFVELAVTTSFVLTSDRAVLLSSVSASQEASGIRRGLPGGDPSLLVVPPVEQWRRDYVFLTPDKYAFDFVTIVARPGDEVRLDGEVLDARRCALSPADGLDDAARGGPTPPYVVYDCQLGFATIDPKKDAPDNLSPGAQSDGVHRVSAPNPVGVLVSGFDAFVSYAYAAGTDLREINVE